jgi:hypothetical protein
MFGLLQIVVLGLAANVEPSYTVHFRELTAPERAVRVPLRGSVAILDAIPALKLPPRDLARMDLWIVRQVENNKVQVLRVDWVGLSQRGESRTNYIVLAGDRLFLQARPAR